MLSLLMDRKMETTIFKERQRAIFGNEQVKIQSVFSNGQHGTGRLDNFGPLYVFNDDIIGPEGYLGLHPHNNVEVITIMLEGIESHEDDKGHYEEILPGYVQLISSGTGIRHAGGNISKTENARHLQIWIDPEVKNTKPLTQLKAFDTHDKSNDWLLQISPDGDQGSVVVKQNAWLSQGSFTAGNGTVYRLHRPGSSVMIYAIEGQAVINGETMERNDTAFITDASELLNIALITDAKLQVIEVL
jgi:redox-sensitive bicupin YhaK (pirin superfamily)